MERRIMLSTPTMHGEEQIFIKEAFDKNWIAPLGFNVDGLEKEVVDYVSGDKDVYALAVSSGTAALHLATRLAGIKQGDVVLSSDMTFIASVNPIIYQGATPVFIDSEKETLNMSPELLEKAFKKYPTAKAVVLVHLYGTPAKLDEIIEVCNRHGVALIEDSAEGLSSEYKGKKLGTFGKFGVYSFNGNKIITTSGGGMLITKDKDLKDKGLFYATQAKEKERFYQHLEIGYNYRMSNVVAGIGRGQLIHLEEHKAKKRAIYERYKQGLKDYPVIFNPHEDCSKPNYWLTVMLIDPESGVTPSLIMDRLEKNNIESRPIWKPMHMQPVFYGYDFITDENKVGENAFKNGICLPSDIKMTEQEQDRVIEIRKGCFNGR